MSGPHHPMYIGQNGQGLVPSQPMGYGYPFQFMAGVRPGAGSTNFMMPFPLQRQNQPGPRVGFRRGPNMQQHFQQQQVKFYHEFLCLLASLLSSTQPYEFESVGVCYYFGTVSFCSKMQARE